MSFSASSMIVEVRGNGCCTVFPGSVHESGEIIEFANPEDYIPDRSTWKALTQAATKIVIATVLYPHWLQERHTRHALALAITAFLTRREWKQEDVSNLVEAIAKEANDEELADRLRCVHDTFAAYAQRKPISGDDELGGLIGTELAVHIDKWVSSNRAKKKTKKAKSGNSSGPAGNGSIDITSDAAAADAFASAFKDRLVYCNGQWFYREVQVLEPTPGEYVQGLAKHFFQKQVAKIATGGLAFSPLKSLLSRTRINAAVELSRPSFYVDPATVDNVKSLVGLAEGNVFDLSTGNTVANGRPLVTRKVGTKLNPDGRCVLGLNFSMKFFKEMAR
jgi:hypothetical protein